MGADRFVNVLNGDGMTFKVAGSDGTTIENESGNIQARERHDSARNCLIAADKNHERIEKISASDKFYRIGDDFAADERSFHPFGTHGDAVGNGNSVELERCAASFADAVFHVLREFAEVIIAGPDFDPGVGDADERLGEVFVLEARSTKHCTRTSSARTLNQGLTAQIQTVLAHLRFPPHDREIANRAEYQLQKNWAISLFWMMARVARKFAVTPPSPALAADSDDTANSYNSGYHASLHPSQFHRCLHRHGARIHFHFSVDTGRCGQHRFRHVS